MRIIQRLRMPGLLSFPPDMEFFDLQSLNVLIGPNASGKSNFIEMLGLLSAMPFDFAAAIRDGGGAAEWLWKGSGRPVPATNSRRGWRTIGSGICGAWVNWERIREGCSTNSGERSMRPEGRR